jgi:GLPGLI family protein
MNRSLKNMSYYLRFFTAALLLCSFYAFNYKDKNITEVPSGIAYYHFIHIRDTTNTGRIWSEDFVMAFNTEKSLYTSQTKLNRDSTRRAKMDQAMKSGNDAIDMGMMMQTTNESIYMFEKEQTTYTNKNFRQNNYLIKAPLEKINWKIDPETKQLLGYTCQKATGICRGREYIAWFSTDIPASFGPWKLHGLPGLILEAYDTSQRIQFLCTKIILTANNLPNVSLTFPPDAIATTDTEYNRMEKAYREGLSSNTSSGDGATIDQATVSRNSAATAHKKFNINFPLERIN